MTQKHLRNSIGIPEDTLLTLVTLHEPQNKAFYKPAMSLVDKYVTSLSVKILTNVASWYEMSLHAQMHIAQTHIL